MSLAPSRVVQAAFVTITLSLLATAFGPPSFQKQLLGYGARASTPTQLHRTRAGASGDTKHSNEAFHDKAAHGIDCNDTGLLAWLTSCGRVPHSWFASFYAWSLACSAFWAIQYLSGGHTWPRNLMQWLAREEGDVRTDGMTQGQVLAVWLAMVFQASRRLYECLTLVKSSTATMWAPHWILGMLYYTGISIAVWIEAPDVVLGTVAMVPGLDSRSLIHTALTIPLLLFAWVQQHRCHVHLASLKKYSLPTEGMFAHIICPHYTCECLIYLSLALMAAPAGTLINMTFVSSLAFVVVNLGLTAKATRDWYIQKFGEEKLKGKWIMIPWLF